MGPTYLGLSVVPSIQSRLITTRSLAYLDFKMHNDGSMDLYFVNNTQSNAVYLNAGNGDWIADVTAAGSNPTRFTNILAGISLAGPGTRENFIRIGHLLVALIMALLGGYISRRLYVKYREAVGESITSQGTTSS